MAIAFAHRPADPMGELCVAKPEWGTKRVCHACGARFYDLGRSPIACPACGAVLDLETAGRARRSRSGSRAAVVEEPEEVIEADEEEAEVDEEEAEEVVDDTVEDEEESDEQRALIEDPSDLGEDDDVSEVIDKDLEDEEH